MKASYAYLVIDDDKTFADLLVRALIRQGDQAISTNSANQALAALSLNPDRIILDLKIGDDSGLRLIKPLMQRYPQAKILLLTGYSSVATAVEAIKLGALHYLCKPAELGDIIHAFDQTGANENAQVSEHRPSIDRLEWEHIQNILHQQKGNVSATARILGMHRRTLQRKLNKRPVKN